VSNQLNHQEQKMASKARRLSTWLRLTGIVFRVLIILGLILLILVIIALIFTALFKSWILVVPFALITLGIMIARVEYRLHKRLNPEDKQELSQTINNNNL